MDLISKKVMAVFVFSFVCFICFVVSRPGHHREIPQFPSRLSAH